MRRHGKTKVGTERYFCPQCGRASTIHRPDTRERHLHDHFVSWLMGMRSKAEIAEALGLTRQALTYDFRQFFGKDLEPIIPPGLHPKMLVADGKYLEGRKLCVLTAVTEKDDIFWRFAPEERYGTWKQFLGAFARPPDVLVADGQKGAQSFVKRHWPDTAFQRCHFHMVLLVTHYLSRNPKTEAGRDIVDLTHRLRKVKTPAERDEWKMLHRIWEKEYEHVFQEKTEEGHWRSKKLRSVRQVMRRALPHLFTYLDFPGCPNTTNLVEGWVNTAIAEGLGRHRGLTLEQKKTLVSVILSHLRREKPTRKFDGKNTPIFP